LKLQEDRLGARVAYGYNVHLKMDAFCIQCLYEFRVKPLEGSPIVITICNEVDFRFRYFVVLYLPHHLLKSEDIVGAPVMAEEVVIV
jgi:hypothetical protein